MSKVETVRGLINQRLSAAAAEIFELFERTIAEYEEQLCRSKEENERQKNLLDVVFSPQLQLYRADVQQLVVSPENVPSEQKKTDLSLDQEDPPEPPHIKEEEKDLWSHQETEQLHGLKEEETTELLLTPVPAKTEDEAEEEPQSSQLHENQTEEILDSGSDTDDSIYYQEESRKLQSGFNHVSDMGCKTVETPDSFSECATNSDQKEQPQKSKKNNLKKEKPYSCSVCDSRFTNKGNLKQHMGIHLSEKPHVCSVCGKNFLQKRYLKYHMDSHSKGKTLHCSICGKGFAIHRSLRRHSLTHSGEKPYSCSVCGKTFVKSYKLREHAAFHSKEKLHSCSLCDAKFSFWGALNKHAAVHMGNKSYSCSACGKNFARSGGLKKHTCDAESSRGK